jgi:hypothetical protein
VRMNSLWNGSLALAAGIGAALILGAPSMAEARTEVLRWTHPDSGSVASFKVYYGTASGNYGTAIDVGKPAPEAGIHAFPLEVPTGMENEDLFIAVTAVDAEGQESLYSNERTREAPTSEVPPADSLGQPGTPQLVP